MKQEKDKTETIIYSYDESTEILFEKIRGWEITSQVGFAVSLNIPKQNELFEKINEAVTNEAVKQNISLIVQRIEFAGNELPGFTAGEIEYYQRLFARDFWRVLHNETHIQHIEDKIIELYYFIQAKELDLKTKQYEFIEDREQDKQDIIEVTRYSKYLQDLLELTKNPPPPKTKTPAETFREKLGKLGFFDLPKVEQLSEIGKGKLIELIANNKQVYGIAMFNELDFLYQLDKKEGTSAKANKKISQLYNEKVKTGDEAKKIRASLIKPTDRHNAKEYKETVRKAYQKLK
jgi:hypothetical protein